MTNPGKVFLVGAGPGDPELLTVRAMRIIGAAEVVVYDRLVSPEILALVPKGATRLFVGKTSGHHAVPQERINQMLVDLARTGRNVVRLKGGDPLVFGRGSEEAGLLAANGIAFEFVPGISAFAGCTAAAGIPLTHRGLANTLHIVTGHARNDEDLDLDWRALADPNGTLVIYMGLGNLPFLTRKLMEAGRAPDTPAAVIENGTTPRQRECVSTLAELPEAVEAQGFCPPSLVVIGDVVRLREMLQPRAPRAEEDPPDIIQPARVMGGA